jgi:riboflavin transporter FmnP
VQVTLEATAGQNIARHVISLAITTVWLGQYILSKVFALVAVYVGRATEANQAAVILRIGGTDMNDAVMLILAFCFTTPHLGDMAKAIIDRKAKS